MDNKLVSMRQLDPIDQALGLFDRTLLTLLGDPVASRPAPKAAEPASLSESEKQLSGALMRVNHVGEVCAQALYLGQGLTERDPAARRMLAAAADEELDHLAWTRERMQALGARPSLLNPLWFGGAFALGLVAGRLGQGRGLGFVLETERQVEAHLQSHLQQLPLADATSRAIVTEMEKDEAGHAKSAELAGATPLPEPVRLMMQSAAKVMTKVAHYI
jgi:3-demethoxyubiquinol 3-hydroxylase